MPAITDHGTQRDVCHARRFAARSASGLVGTSAQVQERVAEFADAGADLLLLQCSPQLEEMERFGEEVIRYRAPAANALLSRGPCRGRN